MRNTSFISVLFIYLFCSSSGQNHRKLCEPVQLSKNYHRAKFDNYHIHDVQQILHVRVEGATSRHVYREAPGRVKKKIKTLQTEDSFLTHNASGYVMQEILTDKNS